MMKKDYLVSIVGIALFNMLSMKCSAQTTVSAVDLGLSIMWATCNVGASTPEDVGGYYAWGMTEEVSVYDWTTYTYCDSETNFHDIGVDISGTQYDVARVKWGGTWRMPTLSEFNELVNSCSWSWTSRNGVYGALVTGPNGNSIFLPAGGRKYGSKGLRDFGEYGCYWSSALASNSGTSSSAKLLLFYDEGCSLDDNRNRTNGMTIRPVTNDASGIGCVVYESKEAKRVYNLTGQQLETPKKGVNIIGGKKIIIRD